MRMCVHVCMHVDGINLKYALCWHINISVHSILCQCIHTSTHTHTLKSFEDGEPMGLKVHTATPIAEVVRANKKDDTTWNHILMLDTAQVNNQPLGHRAAVKWPQVPSNRESPLTTSSSADLASLVHRNQSRTVSPAHPKNTLQRQFTSMTILEKMCQCWSFSSFSWLLPHPIILKSISNTNSSHMWLHTSWTQKCKKTGKGGEVRVKLCVQ